MTKWREPKLQSVLPYLELKLQSVIPCSKPKKEKVWSKKQQRKLENSKARGMKNRHLAYGLGLPKVKIRKRLRI